jgi:hypothetical protein
MFVVSEAEAAVRTFKQCGEFAAAVELRGLFPGIKNTEQAQAIAGWSRWLLLDVVSSSS